MSLGTKSLFKVEIGGNVLRVDVEREHKSYVAQTSVSL